MSMIKTPEEIEALREGGALLSRTLAEIRKACVAGVTSEELDAIAIKRFAEAGGEPSFLGYKIDKDGSAFPGALCVSINDEVVHGLPIPARVIKEGDIVGLDIGVWYKGLCTDMATTVIVGKTDEKTRKLVEDTRESLVRALQEVRAGKFVHDISNAIDDYLTPKGYGIVKDLVGHGVGHAVHEEPQIPHYRERRAPRIKLEKGMVLAIEPMVTLGDWRVYMKDDQWTIATEDGSTSAHFEVTVAVTDTGYELITPWPDQG
ncbi:type I methionyl aminopeptidase [Candidatus Uhrbacteria bacterium]|jgi:methionyl aminopeptidase|nr:MAG: type I methionyl aminopeptidase [Candidatus Uhrbacteria bacterium]